MGGTSAGGNLTAVVSLLTVFKSATANHALFLSLSQIAHLCRDEKMSPPITGCLLMIPAYCYHEAVPEKYKPDYRSFAQNKAAPILSNKAMDLFMTNYCPNEADRRDPLFSPLLWPTGHANLPPSVFQIAGMDPLRDEGLIFERLMREEEGLKTKVEVYPGQPHGFNSVVPTMKASRKYIDDSVGGVKWLFEQK